MSVAHRLIIVGALKARVPFTIRWMKYVDNRYTFNRLLVADGGQDSEREQYLRTYENYLNVYQE